MIDYDNAIEIYTRLVEQEGRSKFTSNLAFLNKRGTALQHVGKFKQAINNYDQAIDIYKTLVEKQQRNELIDVLTIVQNNRDIVYSIIESTDDV